MAKTVIDVVVDQDLCIGCGVCAGVCPKGILSIKFNQYGEYNASLDVPCQSNCGVCLKVCPFGGGIDNEDSLAKERYAKEPGIQHHKAVGYYLQSYYGYSCESNHRLRGASGGLTTWLLENLLVQKKVDCVVCVTANNDPGKLFKFQVFDSVEGVRNSAGSVYYPVELSDIIKYILDQDRRVALVGLPCFIKAVRQAQKINVKLQTRIKYVLGLVCGQLKSRNYTGFVAAMVGLRGSLAKVYYRKKNLLKLSSNFAFTAEDELGESAEIYWQAGVGQVWGNKWFTPSACSYCDDVFAELADVALMDAWLPQYVTDSKGANLLIVRSPDIAALFMEGIDKNQIYAVNISLEEVIRSQDAVLRGKRDHLAYRLYLAEKNGKHCIKKRVAARDCLNFFEKKEIEIKEIMRLKSRENFLRLQAFGQKEIKLFLKEDLELAVFWHRLSGYVSLPQRLARKAYRVLKQVLNKGK